MTEKRFKSENIKFSSFIVDLNSATSKGANTTKYKSYDTNTEKKCDELTDLLNRLNNENEQLKKGYKKLKDRHSLLHDVCIEAECDRDRYHKDVVSLEKENEQLKSLLNGDVE